MHRIPPLPFCDPVFCILILCENARTAPELHVTDSLMIKLKNKKLKIALVAALVLLAGFVIINFRFQYSIFTYFTNYKANMEEELIDKYENWQANLEQREQALGKSEDNQ